MESNVKGPQGKWRVSTVKLAARGKPDQEESFVPFKLSDYEDENPWPFETMVFKEIGMTGFYHEAYGTLEEAKEGHRRIVQLIKSGELPIGQGVTGRWGNPSLTAKEWKEKQ